MEKQINLKIHDYLDIKSTSARGSNSIKGSHGGDHTQAVENLSGDNETHGIDGDFSR